MTTQKKHAARFPGAKHPRPDNYAFRQREAQERQEAYNKLSPTQKLALLDARLGKGVGAERQRARLTEQINKPVKVAVVVTDTTNDVAKKKAKERHAEEKSKHPNH